MVENRAFSEFEQLQLTLAQKDSTEERLLQAQEALEESKARFQAIMNTTVDGIIIINEHGIMQTFNKAAEKNFGYKEEEILGKSISLLMPAPYSIEYDSYLQKYLKIRKSEIIGQCHEMVAKRNDGRIIPIDLSVSAVELGEKTIFAGIIRDISKRKQAEADLREKADALGKSNQELAQFAYVASHDLQEPLRMISSYLNLLSQRYKGTLDKNADDFINFAVGGAQRLQKLINDLLAYSRVGTGGGSFKSTDINGIVKSALNNLKIIIEEKNAEITVDEFPNVFGDGVQLIQLFQNLIGNAIKFHGDKCPKIEIKVKRKIKSWQFTVKDNGIGIDSEHKERIFQIFQRLHTREEYSGTGIGLAICKKIVERHGGTIWVYSEVGKGCSFNFTLNSFDIQKEVYENFSG